MAPSNALSVPSLLLSAFMCRGDKNTPLNPILTPDLEPSGLFLGQDADEIARIVAVPVLSLPLLPFVSYMAESSGFSKPFVAAGSILIILLVGYEQLVELDVWQMVPTHFQDACEAVVGMYLLVIALCWLAKFGVVVSEKTVAKSESSSKKTNVKLPAEVSAPAVKKQNAEAGHLVDLVQRMEKIFDCGDDSDVTVVITDPRSESTEAQTLHLHQSILANRSKFFRDTFKKNKKRQDDS